MNIDELKAKLRQIQQQKEETGSPFRDGAPWGMNPDWKDESELQAEAIAALLEFIGDPEVNRLFWGIRDHVS